MHCSIALRVAVFSDIHGNCIALDTAIGDMKTLGFDAAICLGDTVQGGPQPGETIERLRSLGCPVVLGNADAWLLNEAADTKEKVTKEQSEVREWTLTKLSENDILFLKNYRATVELELGGDRRLLCFHGSPTSYDEILLPETPQEQWDKSLGPFSPAFMAGGHTHTQQVRRVREGLFFNPGSVGVAFNRYLPKEDIRHDAWAEYAMLVCDENHVAVQFRRVNYEVEELSSAIQESGRPYGRKMIDDYRRPSP